MPASASEMDSRDFDPRHLLEEHLALIDRRVRQLCRRYGVADHEADDVVQEVFYGLIDDDFHRIRAWEKKSSLPTFLTTVATRLALDHFDKIWGRRWRPSAQARRLGETAIRIDALLTRDRLSRDEAFNILTLSDKVEISRAEFDAIADRLPERWKRHFTTPEAIETRPDPGLRPDQHSAARERWDDLQTALSEVEGHIRALQPEDRLLLQLWRDGMTIAEISRQKGWPQKPLYQRLDKLLEELREKLIAEGFGAEVLEALGLDFE